jgi:hypothetical protein
MGKFGFVGCLISRSRDCGVARCDEGVVTFASSRILVHRDFESGVLRSSR